MASSENLATIDSWFADYISRDAETITKALQNSTSTNDAVSPYLNLSNHDVSAGAVTTSTVCGHSGGSDQESAPKRRVGATGKVSKRKPRASKRSQTTFFTADPANFREMVQQVTGKRLGGSGMKKTAPVLKPEPQRLNGGFAGGVRLVSGTGCLPTLDTSSFLLDHHQQQVVGQDSETTVPGFCGQGPLTLGPPIVMVDGPFGTFGTLDIDFDTLSSFSTLDSWKVM